MQHKQILAQGGNVHYWIDKKDDGVDCIVFTHGVTADHTMFEKQIEFFSDKYSSLGRAHAWIIKTLSEIFLS